MNNKKQCVSVRLKPSDIEKVEKIARRLGVRNSDIMRYAIKTALTRLINFQNPTCLGKRLIPTLIQNANELNRHLDIDSDRLDNILNDGIHTPEERISRDDIELLALCGLPAHQIQPRLESIVGRQIDLAEVNQFVEDYLTEKYLNARS